MEAQAQGGNGWRRLRTLALVLFMILCCSCARDSATAQRSFILDPLPLHDDLQAYRSTLEARLASCTNDGGECDDAMVLERLHADVALSSSVAAGLEQLHASRQRRTTALEQASFMCASNATLEVLTLQQLYRATGGARWKNNQGWATAATNASACVCDWFGVTCVYNDDSGSECGFVQYLVS